MVSSCEIFKLQKMESQVILFALEQHDLLMSIWYDNINNVIIMMMMITITICALFVRSRGVSYDIDTDTDSNRNPFPSERHS